MTVKKIDGRFYADLSHLNLPANDPLLSRNFPNRAEAAAYGRAVTQQAQKNNTQPSDKRKLSDLAELWFKLYGKTLSSGETRLSYLNNIITTMGDPIAATYKANDYIEFRSRRVESVSVNTANHDLTYLKSLYNQLIDAGELTYENPLSKVKKLRDKKKPKVRCLDAGEIRKLLNELETRESHAYVIAYTCLSTGARWSEPLSLRKEDIQFGQLTFTDTKNGDPRTLPISPKLEKLLLDNIPLKDGYKVFQRVIDELKIDLPANQLTHVLRHTFAKSFIRNGGRINDLQKILDHESIETTMIYAQFAKYHLIDVLKYNPINEVETSSHDGTKKHLNDEEYTNVFWPFPTA